MNFVFQSPDNRTLYIGTAAHCLEGEEANETVWIHPLSPDDPFEREDPIEAHVVYNSWSVMSAMGTLGSETHRNDFALIEIPEEARHLVHPAMRHYGGPTELGDELPLGERLLTYGASPNHWVEETRTGEGYTTEQTEWYIGGHWVSNRRSGDSGSPVITGTGKAVGVHSGYSIPPYEEVAAFLPAALEFAREHAGLEVELATWDLIDPGQLPELPIP